MAYATGVVNSWSDLRTAIFSACTANGWTLSGDIVSKGSAFVQITVSASVTANLGPGLVLQGGTGASGSTLVNPSPAKPRIGRSSSADAEPGWPATYHLFTFSSPDEVYCVLNFDVDKHLFCAFGVSQITMPGTGLWMTASCFTGVFTQTYIGKWVISQSFGCSTFNPPGYVLPSGGPFWVSNKTDLHTSSLSPDCINHGYDGATWSTGNMSGNYDQNISGTPSQGAFITLPSVYPFFQRSPSAWNQESILAPIRGYVQRPSNKATLVMDLVNARYTRVDNHEPGDILTLGSDRWMVFPFYLKNTTTRNGATLTTMPVEHTGTFGWAIRYDGP